jgi:hypothetical protein
MATELPLPLTDAVLALALAELDDAFGTVLQACLRCYRSKSMSSDDLLAFARSIKRYSSSLAAVFDTEEPQAFEQGFKRNDLLLYFHV